MDKEEQSASARPSPARNTSVNQQQDDEQIDEPAHESQGNTKYIASPRLALRRQ
jgi:hypothetical protein